MQTNISAEMSLDVVCITLMFFSEGFHSALIDIYKCNQAVTARENMKRRNWMQRLLKFSHFQHFAETPDQP